MKAVSARISLIELLIAPFETSLTLSYNAVLIKVNFYANTVLYHVNKGS